MPFEWVEYYHLDTNLVDEWACTWSAADWSGMSNWFEWFMMVCSAGGRRKQYIWNSSNKCKAPGQVRDNKSIFVKKALRLWSWTSGKKIHISSSWVYTLLTSKSMTMTLFWPNSLNFDKSQYILKWPRNCYGNSCWDGKARDEFRK